MPGGPARWVVAVAALHAFVPLVLAQEQPFGVRAFLTTGYYSTYSRGQTYENLNFVPLGARFEMDGFYRSPDLINFSAQPELTVGPQASEAGFQGGNGIRFRMTALRKLLPISFRYSNVQVEDVYFGSLTQVSGYTLKDRNKDLGATLELKSKRLPAATIDWGTSSVNSTSDITQVADYIAHSNHVNADAEYGRWGWIMNGFVHYETQQSNLLEPLNGGTQPGTLYQTVVQYQGSARRTFFDDWEWYMDAGSQSTSSLLFTLPIDLTTHYASASLRLFQKRRFKTMLRANYSSNLASQLLAQAVSSIGGANAVVPDQTALAPFSHGMSMFNFTGITRADLAYGFGMYAGVERNDIFSSDIAGPLNAGYFTTSAGLTYNKRLGWGSVSGEYEREFGLGSITGQSGTIQGQDWRAGVQKGGARGLQLDATVHGSEQSVRNAQPLSNNSISAEGTIGSHLFGDFSGRIGGGWQWGSIVNSANDFKTNGYTARFAIEHPRLQVNATLNNALSNSLPFYGEALGGLGVGGIVFAPLSVIPSDYRAQSVTVHAYPLKKVELSAMWTRSRQHLDSVLTNDFLLMDYYLTYHFRKIQFEAGFIRSNQVFAYYPYTLRQRFYIRIVRSAKLL